VLPAGIGAEVVRLARLHRAAAGAMLAEIGLHPGQEALLFALRSGERSPGQLAASLGVEPATVTKMVRRLEAAGLVASGASAVDRRSRIVRLTSAGERAAAAADQVWHRLEELTGDGLTIPQRKELQRLLAKASAGLLAAAPRGASCVGD
jgi:MarR family transcriptional regulator, organic hydroperoxide resistance regulator